jgi:hypothetical protein
VSGVLRLAYRATTWHVRAAALLTAFRSFTVLGDNAMGRWRSGVEALLLLLFCASTTRCQTLARHLLQEGDGEAVLPGDTLGSYHNWAEDGGEDQVSSTPPQNREKQEGEHRRDRTSTQKLTSVALYHSPLTFPGENMHCWLRKVAGFSVNAPFFENGMKI